MPATVGACGFRDENSGWRLWDETCGARERKNPLRETVLTPA